MVSDGSTEQLWQQLVDRPGTLQQQDSGQARLFAHEAAAYFRDVIVIRCAGRSLPMVMGEVALAIGVKLRGTIAEACEQIAGALADARLLLLLEGPESGAPFVREGQTSVLYAPAGEVAPQPPAGVMSEAFVHWPSRTDECAAYLPYVESVIESDEWHQARRMGRAAFAFLYGHERLFEAAYIARMLLGRAVEQDDEETAGWAREEISWISGGERVRTARAPVEQLSLSFA
jgi:hypothetical protein